MLSIIVLVHNRDEMSAECLLALSRSVSGLSHEVICVDNASTEPLTRVRAAGRRFQRFRLLQMHRGHSYSGANNVAASAACGERLLFLNNDVQTGERALSAMMDCLQEETRVGAVGPRLLFGGGQRVQHAGIQQMLWGYVSNFGAGAAADDRRLARREERFAVTGAMLMVSRQAFDQVGGFDERYHWGYEDVDLCLRLRAQGWAVCYEPGGESLHLESATLAGVRSLAEAQSNYRMYRRTWDFLLVPGEQAFLQRLGEKGVRRVVIWGRGQAAAGLCHVLESNGLQVAGFCDPEAKGPEETFCGRCLVPPAALERLRYDRLMAGTQFYFQLEEAMLPHDPLGQPIFPQIACPPKPIASHRTTSPLVSREVWS